MRAPKTWGFVLRPADLHAVSRRRFVLRFTPPGALLAKPPSAPPPFPPLPAPGRRR